jgi:membrane-bound metal-dependent hydrolase YbcI (DUF457 family)
MTRRFGHERRFEKRSPAMDIVTHGLMGVAVGGPFLGRYPAAPAGLILGSAAPDLDALSRCLGKRSFLRCHQGWTHSIPLLACLGGMGELLTRFYAPDLTGMAAGFALGAILHAMLDLTNTYGVRVLAPFSSRRFCLEWVFFIDGVVIGLTIAAFLPAAASLLSGNEPSRIVVGVYLAALLAYIGGKALIARRARRLADPNSVSVIPSAVIPWEYFVCRRAGDGVSSWKLNAVTGRQVKLAECRVLDAEFAEHLDGLPEYREMRSLSPAYHVIACEHDGEVTRIRCRDLRIINFNTSFGTLDVTLDRDSAVRSYVFHV